MSNTESLRQMAQQIHDTFGIPVVYHDTQTGESFSTEPARSHRPLHEIAREIRSDWSSPYFGAVPYLDALRSLDQITDRFYEDTAEDVVMYLLANLSTWRGDTARRVKAELKDILKGARR
jgi:ribosomal protein L31